ncbi:MAG: response regulator [Proteobacteria bacterium]|nr:response regulator [Pseudomonadota bacterium]
MVHIRKSSIVTRLILALLGSGVLLIIASTGLRFYYDYNLEMRLLDERIHEVQKSSIPVMESSIWLGDWDIVRVQGLGIQQLPQVLRVEVAGEEGELVAIGEEATEGTSKYTFPLVQQYKGKEVSLGTLILYADEGAIRKRLLGQVAVELFGQLVIILIITSILFYLFHRLAGRHLIAMASQLRVFGRERLVEPLVLDKKRTGNLEMDEIDQLVFSFNEMQQNLQYSFVELRQANDDLSSENRERVKVEEVLRENRAMLRNILDTVPQAILWKDRQSMYLGCNKVLAKSVGLDNPDQIVGKTDFDLPWSRTEAEAYRADDREVVQAKQSKRHILEPMQQADGVRLWVDTTKVPLLDEKDNVYAILGVYTDITERIRAEEEKSALESRLRQSQKMEAIGVLAGGIAHDFNNILAVILGYTEMAKEDAPSGSRFARDLDNVLTSTLRAKELVKQILSFSRQSSLDRMVVKIQPLVQESLKMLRASIPTTITIEEKIDQQSGTILADPTQVHQVVMNLCTNAFHAMENTGGVLSVGVKLTTLDSSLLVDGQQISPGEYVELTVSDTGIGIGQDIIDKIFDPYFTTKGVGKGTGMGLSISYGIVKSYGGTITVESTVGQGTTFHVYFPVIQEEEQEPEKSQDIPGGKERILFVDDEELLVALGRDMLEHLGYTVTGRDSSIEALETFMNDPNQFDLVITDQTMPGLTGTDLARKILQVRPDLPIILCTGYSSQVSEEAAKAIGIKEFAFKPLSISSIAQLVRRVLDGETA